MGRKPVEMIDRPPPLVLTEYQVRAFPIVCAANGKNLRAMMRQRLGGLSTRAFLHHAPGLEHEEDSPPPNAIRLGAVARGSLFQLNSNTIHLKNEF